MADEETKGVVSEDKNEVKEVEDADTEETKEDNVEEEGTETKDNDNNEDEQEKDEPEDMEVQEEKKENNVKEDEEPEKEEEDEDAEEEKDEEDDDEEEKETEEKKEVEKKKPTKDEAKTLPKKDSGVPLYDQPLEKSGKRDRKKVERFVQETKKEELEVAGSGVAFADIPFIDAMITKLPVEDLKVLHRVAFNRPGSGNEVKKNLRKFNGFPYTKDDKKYQNKVLTVERILMSEVKRMLKIVGVDMSGNKGEVVERLLAFMLKPHNTGKKPPKAKDQKKGGRGRPKKSQGDKKKKKKENSKGASADSGSSGSGSSEEEDEEEDEDKDEEDQDEDEEEVVKKKVARRKSKGTPRGRGGGGAGRGRGAKRARTAPDSDDSESDDEPLVKKKAKQPPTDGELKAMVKKILEGANLEEVTMKSVCRQVYDSYPAFDLTHKKLFIKETVKSIIS